MGISGPTTRTHVLQKFLKKTNIFIVMTLKCLLSTVCTKSLPKGEKLVSAKSKKLDFSNYMSGTLPEIV